MLAETDAERRVWELLTRDFYWQIPADFSVKLYRGSAAHEGPARLQVFEVAVAAIFARLRPEYEWYVTPNQPDGGLDFVGRHGFLEDEALGIAAAITVGGQCKKRTRVNDIVDEVAGSLARMATAINPTFFVVALSARLHTDRVGSAREILERTYQRNCHILDRHQLEGLIHDNLGAVTEILHEGLSHSEACDVLNYFEAFEGARSAVSLDVAGPRRVLAGVPFTVTLNVRSLAATTSGEQLWWSSSAAGGGEPADVTLIGPLGVDGSAGVALLSDDAEDPIRAQHIIELITYSVGEVDLGELRVGNRSHGASGPSERIALGHVQVLENVRPRFFERPFRAGLARLGQEYDRALARGVASIGVVGAGGSGKSRLCEEFALERRRRGARVVSAKQAKTLDDPRRVLADLFIGLVPDEMSIAHPADHVIRAIERYDPSLAERAAPAVRSVFGVTEGADETATDQSILSALLLLIVAQGRRVPLIVHLQDLHWCAADVLLMLERLIWQLDQILSAPGAASRSPESGILFVFEGRARESGDLGGDAWSSAPFEAFLARTASTRVTCKSFTSEDGLSFSRLLFEDRHNVHRLLADDLLGLQDELVNRVWRTAGGNPFHTLEQVRLLKELGVIGQNPKTGLLYMVRPEPVETLLPESVFAAIQLRWEYMRSRAPDLALLVWGSALLGDQIDAPLFRWLWSELAPDVSLRDVDATDMLWTEDGTAHDVVFRHENYFESIRRFTVSESDRLRVVEAYCGWFAGLRRPDAAQRFAWARALLELPDPDRTRARALLASALKSSRRAGDPRVIRRILGFYLDLTWDVDERSPIAMKGFLRRCDEERDLCRDLLGVDRDQAAKRIGRIRERIESRVEALGGRASTETRDGLVRRLLTVESLHAQLLFNDRRPTESADITKHVIARVRAHRLRSPQDESWELLEMEALYTQSCAQAISGEFGPAVQSSAAAAEIATRSQSSLARKVLSTYGTMLLSNDPKKGESLLRECLAQWPDDESSDAFLVHVHLSMALVLQAYRCPRGSENRRAMLNEARDRMTRVHDSCRSLGLYPDAGAAALVRGIVSALSDEGDETAWFAQGVAAGSRGRQMEILWRSHINLAMAVYRNEQRVTPTARDHALAALEIMQDTLTVYSEPERSPRFEMLRVGMAAAVWMLLATEDERGLAVLERYPALRTHFSDPGAGVLAPYDGGPRHYQWLRVEDVDYMLY